MPRDFAFRPPPSRRPSWTGSSEQLLELADSFLDTSKHAGTAELAEGLEDVFKFTSQYLSDPVAEPFRSYYAAVQVYEEECREGKIDPVPVRPRPPPFGQSDPEEPLTQLSNATLENKPTDIQFERTQRLVNNVSPRVNANRGRTLNDLNARLLIERTVYYSDLALKLNLPPRSQLTQENCPNLVRDLINYACFMLASERLQEQDGGEEEGKLLIKQLIPYMYREAPFNDPCVHPLQRLSWWKARQNNSDASQVAKLGIRLFSVSASEMCDERTASKMGTWSTAKRNGLGPFSIIDMGILEKYWKYGFNSGNVYTHTAQLSLDKFDVEAGPPRTLPAPTLQELLNPILMAADPSDDTMFNNPDPYGAAALDEEEESDNKDVEMLSPEQGPRVVRSFDAPRLAIEEYINLETTALLARLEPNGAKNAGSAASAPVAPTATQKEKWTAEKTSWAKKDAGW
ncbi:hypothetical protein B0H19DRAFT_1275684 [Mycena capillaripes]|nr:hypothetical protein B0H19DRAFT_1275684 [Mycena capillaripes]